MAIDRFVYDKKKGEFVRKRTRLRSILLSALAGLAGVCLTGVAFYAVFALVFSTERELVLERENRLLSDEYTRLSGQLDLLDGTVGQLRMRDRSIYQDLFSSDPPDYISETRDTLLSGGDLESVAESDLVWDAYAVVSRMETTASQVSRWLTEIDTLLSGGSSVARDIPSIVPLASFSPVQTGASVGKKINPFYKTIREHTGIDLLAPTGSPVRCTADGKVTEAVRSRKGMGNRVTVSHAGGYQTVYAHLDEMRVSVGQTVRQGDLIGTVGTSGTCFGACLHYEVHRGGSVEDPVHYFFADLSPSEYRSMMVVARTTGQSMD